MTFARTTVARFTSAHTLSAALIAMVALPVVAQRPPNPEQIEQLRTQMAERFVKADANRDGRLTREEANGKMPRLHQRFDQVDKDGDGYVNQADIIGYAESLVAQRR